MRNSAGLLFTSRIVGAVVAVGGIVALVAAPLIGDTVSERLWGVEPLTYFGAVLVVVGLAAVTAAYFIQGRTSARNSAATAADETTRLWSELTQQTFDLFHHDLGRPFTRILSKERELRSALSAGGAEVDPRLMDMLQEIERQGPNFRLMLSNIQVLIQLEAPNHDVSHQPVEPSEIVRRIVDRYSSVALESGKEITWWAEPTEFGIVYSDNSAVEHIVTNLIDNAVRFASGHVEVKLTKNPTHFFIRVWDDGPGISAQYVAHLFDRGWTPEVARRDEKTSSGLGLHIARTLALRYGGDITIETVAEPDAGHHTSFLASLALNSR